jgi:hypothetical protein
MGSPLLQIVQQAQAELGLPISQFVIQAPGKTAPDNSSRQFGALATRLGQFLVRRHAWSFLRSGWIITVPPPVNATGQLTAGSTLITNLVGGAELPALLPALLAPAPFPLLLPNQMVVTGLGLTTATRLLAADPTAGTITVDQPATASGPTLLQFHQDQFQFPPDWERAVARTQWDRSMRWELRGAETPQQSQWLRSGIVSTGPRRHYQEIDGGYRIWPPPSATDAPAQLVAEYISNGWVSSGGTPQSRFMADSDTCLFPDDLMTVGLELLFWRQKGFEASHLEAAFADVLAMTMASDGGSQTLDMTRRGWPIFLSPANIQDSSFPGFGNP